MKLPGIGIDGVSQEGTAVRGLSTKDTALYAESLVGCAIDASNISEDEPAIYALTPYEGKKLCSSSMAKAASVSTATRWWPRTPMARQP